MKKKSKLMRRSMTTLKKRRRKKSLKVAKTSKKIKTRSWSLSIRSK